MAFTPGAAECLANAAAMIANTTSKADSIRNDQAMRIYDPATGVIAGIDALAGTFDITADVANAAPVVEPIVTIPASIDVSTITDTFHTEYNALVALLAGELTSFLTAHFPSDQADYNAAEGYLLACLTSGTGIPAALQAQLLTEDKDRINAEGTRATDAVMKTFAARRFPLPPGAAASATLQIAQKGQDDIATSSRKIMISSLERMQWAAEKVVGLRQLAMGQAIDYIKALASGPDIASRVTGIGYDAQTKLISAVSQFYGARTDVAKLITQNSQFNVTQKLGAAEKNQMADLAMMESKIKTLVSEAQALAQMATSLYNNLHASAGTSYSVSISEATAV